jgi:hypothetical protein
MKIKYINSFDLFDTLIFRACYEPENIFSIIEKNKKILDFRTNRSRLQQILYIDTYKKLQTYYNWDDNYTEEILKYELKIEEENICPIWCNIKKVKPEDIIVSDMYLPQDFLEMIIKKYDLYNKLYVRYDGKRMGYIWDIIKNDGYNIHTHHGDNIYSDIIIPKVHSIYTVYLDTYKFTDVEKKIDRNVALCIRYVRLLSKYEKGLEHIYQTVCLNNIQILIHYCQYLYKFAMDNNFDKLLFITRDCVYLYIIFNILYGKTIKSSIFFCSRYSFRNRNIDFDTYVDNVILDSNKSLIVDIHGSGYSFKEYFLDYRNIKTVHIIFYCIQYTTYLKNRMYKINNIHFFRKNSININENLELLNLVSFGSVYSFNKDKPCFSDIEYPSYIIYPIETCIENLISYLNIFFVNETFNINFNNINIDMFNIHAFLEHVKPANCNYYNYITFRKKFNIEDNLIFNNQSQKNILDINCFMINQNIKRDRFKHTIDLLQKINIHNLIRVIPYKDDTVTDKNLQIFLKYNSLNSSFSQKSHFLTYVTILKNSLDSSYSEDIFILEDDLLMLYNKDLTREIIKYIINNHPSDADLIYLEYCNNKCEKNSTNFTMLKSPYCTGFIYYPTKKSREKILNEILNYYRNNISFNIIDSTDGVISYLISNKKIKAYSHIPVFTQDHRMISSIEGSTKSKHMFCNNINDKDIHYIQKVLEYENNMSTTHKYYKFILQILKNDEVRRVIKIIFLLIIIILGILFICKS